MSRKSTKLVRDGEMFGIAVRGMVRRVGQSYFWIDVTAPTTSELEELAEAYGLYPLALKDCLDPLHLPKFEAAGATKFVILRHADPDALRREDADTVRELTRKLAIFVLPQGLITVHRASQPLVDRCWESFDAKRLTDAHAVRELLLCLIKHVILSYDVALDVAEKEFEGFENRVLDRKTDGALIEALYFLKRRVSVYRKMVRASMDAVARIDDAALRTEPNYQDMREEGDRQFFHADEMVDDTTQLLQTQLALAAHRTNEIIRVLTLFSVFFLPLTFIVGVYGMNFKFMPELDWRGGYAAVWAVMIVTTLAIHRWFKAKHWL